MNDDLTPESKELARKLYAENLKLLEGLAELPESKPPYMTRGLVGQPMQAETQKLTKEELAKIQSTAEELAAAKAEIARLKSYVALALQDKAAAEAETDAFMEYHEQEMQHVYGIRQAHGTAVVAIQVDRQQFLHARTPERLEEMVKLVTIQTLEALLAGTPGREVFDRLTRELVRQRSAANQG